MTQRCFITEFNTFLLSESEIVTNHEEKVSKRHDKNYRGIGTHLHEKQFQIMKDFGSLPYPNMALMIHRNDFK